MLALAAIASPVGYLIANAHAAPSLSRLTAIAFVVWGLGMAITLVLRRFARPGQGVATSVAGGLLVFTYIGLLEPLMSSFSPIGFMLLGVTVSLAVGLGTYLLQDRWPALRDVMFWMVAALVVVPTIILVLQVPSASAEVESGGPDVVVIFVDGYAGSQTLGELYAYDNEWFVSGLEDLGFEVDPSARAAYSMTYASLASVLEMEYVLEPGPISDRTLRPEMYRLMQGDNAFVKSMDAAGYRYRHIESGWGGTKCGPSADVCNAAPFLEGTVWSFTQRTALGPMMRVWFGHAFLGDSLDRLDQLEDLTLDPTVSELVIAHILLPHPPLLLDSSCNVFYERNLAFMVSGHPDDSVALSALRHSAYLGQLECLNDRLLHVATNPAFLDSIVIVVGDHGSDSQGQLVTPVADWTDSMIEERLTTILAIRGCDQPPPQDTINALRFVRSCALGHPYEALAPRQFLVPVAANHPEDDVIEMVSD